MPGLSNTQTGVKDFNVKTETDLTDQAKHSGGKWNSNKENTIGNEIYFAEKPSKSDKWNHYKDKENDVYDEYIYWDSINNHVDTDRKKTSRKVGLNYQTDCIDLTLNMIYESCYHVFIYQHWKIL